MCVIDCGFSRARLVTYHSPLSFHLLNNLASLVPVTALHGTINTFVVLAINILENTVLVLQATAKEPAIHRISAVSKMTSTLTMHYLTPNRWFAPLTAVRIPAFENVQ
jgi:hypothetical protein